MNYTELKTNIQDICEDSFTDDQLAMFTEQAEQKIYNTVQIPALRKNQTGTTTASNTYLTAPSDWLYVYSLAVVDGSGNYTYLLNKDTNFIREAYPTASSTGLPKHYGIFVLMCFSYLDHFFDIILIEPLSVIVGSIIEIWRKWPTFINIFLTPKCKFWFDDKIIIKFSGVARFIVCKKHFM